MSTTTEYELSNIETFVLKVHMHCQGCINRVRKLLRKIEGVYQVHIIGEEHKVIVTGCVDPSTLVKKLVKSGKHAEIWNASSNQEQEDIDFTENHNKNQTQHLTNDPNFSENQYITFGREDHHWGPEWFSNQNLGTRAIERQYNQNFGRPSIVNVVNRGTNYSGLGSQEWGWNLYGVSPISKHFHPPYVMNDIYGDYHSYQPWKMMHMNYYNHLPSEMNIHMQE